MYLLFPSMICPSDHEKIMEYLQFFSVQLSLQYLCLSSQNDFAKYKRSINSICQNHPIFPVVFIIKVIPTIFISFYINGGTLGAISHTGARQHPDSVLGPLKELVNDKLSGPGVLDLYDCGLAVTAGLGHDEYFVVANDAILFIFWGRLPNYPQGA